jgi:hypothetical protein
MKRIITLALLIVSLIALVALACGCGSINVRPLTQAEIEWFTIADATGPYEWNAEAWRKLQLRRWQDRWGFPSLWAYQNSLKTNVATSGTLRAPEAPFYGRSPMLAPEKMRDAAAPRN